MQEIILPNCQVSETWAEKLFPKSVEKHETSNSVSFNLEEVRERESNCCRVQMDDKSYKF